MKKIINLFLLVFIINLTIFSNGIDNKKDNDIYIYRNNTGTKIDSIDIIKSNYCNEIIYLEKCIMSTSIGKINCHGDVVWSIQTNRTTKFEFESIIEINRDTILAIGIEQNNLIFVYLDHQDGHIRNIIGINKFINTFGGAVKKIILKRLNENSNLLVIQYANKNAIIFNFNDEEKILKSIDLSINSEESIIVSDIIIENNSIFIAGIIMKKDHLRGKKLFIAKFDEYLNALWSKEYVISYYVDEISMCYNMGSIMISLNEVYFSKYKVVIFNLLINIDDNNGKINWIKQIKPENNIIINGLIKYNDDKILLFGSYGKYTPHSYAFENIVKNANPLLLIININGKLIKSLYSPLENYRNNSILDIENELNQLYISINYAVIADCSENALIIIYGTSEENIINSKYFININNIVVYDYNFKYEEDKLDILISNIEYELLNKDYCDNIIKLVAYGNDYYKLIKDNLKNDEFLMKNNVGKNLTVTIDNLNFRENQFIKSRVIRKLSYREKIKILDVGQYEIIDNLFGYWVKCRTQKGEIGWCFSAYLFRYWFD